MPISAANDATLQNQYDSLRSQGMSVQDATSNIKSSLQSYGANGANAFDTLKSQYNNGGVEGGWIPNSTVKAPVVPTTTVVPPVTANTGVVTSPTSTTGTSVTAPPSSVSTPADTGAANTTPLTTGTSGVAETKALTQNELDRKKAVKQTQDSYILNKANYEANKGLYTNFDSVNTQFDGIMKEREAALTASPNGSISPEQAQQIAAKYGVTPEAVTNPTKLFEALTPTEEGKLRLGITGYENQMTDAATANERAKADAATALQQTTDALTVQMDDVRKQLDRNLQVMTAQGAWSGGLKSSGYIQGIQNVQQDGQATLNKLQTMLDNVRSTNAKDVGRLTEDYTIAVKRAKEGFDLHMKDVQHNAGLSLNEATTKYGASSEELGRALDDINAKYGANAADISAKFLQNMKMVNDITNQNIDIAKKSHDYVDSIANQRFSEYLDKTKGPALIGNASYTSLAQEVNSGKLSLEQLADIKSQMLSSITTTLSNYGTVSNDDINNIQHMLEVGKTPIQVVASMQTLEKFKSDVPKTEKQVINGELYEKDPKTGSWNKAIASSEPTTSTGGVPNSRSIISYSQDQRGKTALQCGELVNDYIKQQAGTKGTLGNSINDKVSAINSIGVSPTPQVGGIFVLNTGSYTGHTGIVKSVNDDGSITVIEANRENSADGGIPKEGTYPASSINNMAFSQAIGSTGGTGKQYTDSQKNLMDIFGGKALTKAQEQDLKNAKLSVNDYADYSAQKKAGRNGTSSIDSIAEKVANYKLTPVELNNLRKDPAAWSDAMSKVIAINPQFDDSKYAANKKFLVDWQSGTTATSPRANLNAFNTAMNHISSMYEAAEKLNNSKYPWWNAIANPSAVQTGDTNVQKAIEKFSSEKNAALTEVAKAIKGGVLNKSDVEDFKDRLNESSSPAQIKGAVEGIMDLMMGRASTLSDNYYNTLGKKPEDVFTQDSYNAINNLKSKGLEFTYSPEDIGGNIQSGGTSKQAEETTKKGGRIIN